MRPRHSAIAIAAFLAWAACADGFRGIPSGTTRDGADLSGDGYSIDRTAGVDAITLSEPIEQLGVITGVRAMHEIGLDNCWVRT